MGKLTITSTEFKGLYVIDTNPFIDDRGAFARWFCNKELEDVICNEKIVNVNFSKTIGTGTVRGMHYQNPPNTEMKLIRCIKGKILDVVVDIRKNSPTFLQYFKIELSEDNMKMLVIPKGFAHGFQTLDNDCEIMYLVSNYYAPESENGLNPNDPKININWPLPISNISKKDKERKYLDDTFTGI